MSSWDEDLSLQKCHKAPARVHRSLILTSEAANRLDQAHLLTGRTRSDLVCEAILSCYVPGKVSPAVLQQATALATTIVRSVLVDKESKSR